MTDERKKSLALVLLSGGLDSVLAAKIMIDQGLRVEAIGFSTPFFDAEKGKGVAGRIGIPFHEIDFSAEHWEKVKQPRYGHGGGINPCIDCHALMIERAWDLLKGKRETDMGFVVTGEVLGQRPMSQNKQALGLVEKASGIPKGRLLRPLSAKLLEPTELEERGRVDREKLFDISGRGRGRQLELAERWGIDYYAPPAGGCVLTEKGFGQRVKELLGLWPEADYQTAGLLRWGRIFYNGDSLIVVARQKEENDVLKGMARMGDVVVGLANMPGPMALLRALREGDIVDESIEEAKKLVTKYSRQAKERDLSELDFLVERSD